MDRRTMGCTSGEQARRRVQTLSRSQLVFGVILIIVLLALLQPTLVQSEQHQSLGIAPTIERFRHQSDHHNHQNSHHPQYNSQQQQHKLNQNEIIPNKFAPNQQLNKQHKNNTTSKQQQQQQQQQLQLISSSPAPIHVTPNEPPTTYTSILQPQFTTLSYADIQNNSSFSPTESTSAPVSQNQASSSSISPGPFKEQTTTAATTTTTSTSSMGLSATELPEARSSSSTSSSTRMPKQSESAELRPASNRSSKITSAHQQQQQQQQSRLPRVGLLSALNGDLIDQMSTSQSVSFAEPLMAASSRQQEQHQQLLQQSSHPQPLPLRVNTAASNRWTHFGARLRPLTASGAIDHHGSDSKSSAAFAQNNNNNNNKRTGTHLTANQQASSNNKLDDQDGDDSEDDDDQDSEALLYKMMQQQGFLTGSIWQQQPQAQARQTQLPNELGGSQQNLLSEAPAAGGGGVKPSALMEAEANAEMAAAARGEGSGKSRKVIKLLKSYSHIHQVDDSDDQIRGTYTRVQPNRQQPNEDNSNSWQQAATRPRGNNNNNKLSSASEYNRNRPINNGQQQSAARHSPQHIYVSSQPLARATSNSNNRHQQPAVMGDLQSQNYNTYPNNEQANNAIGGSNPDYDSSNQEPPQEEEDFECPNNGIFADEASGCQSYHVCQSGAQVQQKFQCPMGTLFNNIILTCDFAHNVQCRKDSPKQFAPSTADEQLANDQIHRNSQQQQQQQQQARWQQQQQPQQSQQGPRSLKVGQSQYNQHQAQTPNPQAQAVSVYPLHNQMLSSSSPAPPGGDDSNDDSDDDPIEPLKPATLPPPRQHQMASSSLPYNAPPAVAQLSQAPQAPRSPLVGQYPSNNLGQSQQYNQHHHQQQQQQSPPSMMSNYNREYDGDSTANPVFASRDEPRTTEATTNSFASQSLHQLTRNQPSPTAAVSQTEAQSFNLVINHLTPTRQQPKINPSPSPENNNIIRPTAQLAANKQNQHLQQPAINKQPANLAQAYNKKLLQEKNKQQFNLANKQSNFAHQSNIPQPYKQQQQQQQAALNSPVNYDNRRYQQATQLKSVHVDASASPIQQQQQQQPKQQQYQQTSPVRSAPIVDLTNDKRSSVSSETINDGLLLIVRHGSGSGNGNGASDVQYYKQQLPQPGNKKGSSIMGSAQAYAVEPSAIKPNSPVDAQLFPNVQRVLAASQHVVSHQSPPTSVNNYQSSASTAISPTSVTNTQYIQHQVVSNTQAQHHHHQKQQQQQQQQHQPTHNQQQQYHQQANNNQLNRLTPVLPPMEPPKPNIQYKTQENHNQQQQYNNNNRQANHMDSLQSVASSASASAASALITPPPTTISVTTPASSSSAKPLSENKKINNQQQHQMPTGQPKPKKIKKPKSNQASIKKQTSSTEAPIRKTIQQRQQSPSSTTALPSVSTNTPLDQPVALVDEQQFLRINSRAAVGVSTNKKNN